jgi:hypothetical protein
VATVITATLKAEVIIAWDAREFPIFYLFLSILCFFLRYRRPELDPSSTTNIIFFLQMLHR